jgi:hypothetical protein
VHIERPPSVPSSAEVKASFDPNKNHQGEVTNLASITSGDTEIRLRRYDWPDCESAVTAELRISNEEDFHVSINGNDIPMQMWQHLTELANAATLASQQLLAMIAAGTWA